MVDEFPKDNRFPANHLEIRFVVHSQIFAEKSHTHSEYRSQKQATAGLPWSQENKPLNVQDLHYPNLHLARTPQSLGGLRLVAPLPSGRHHRSLG